MLTRHAAEDPAIRTLLGDAHARLDALRRDAEPGARAFYREVLGEELGIEEAIARIFADVDADGDSAVRAWSRRFDAVAADPAPIPAADLEAAWRNCDDELKRVLEHARRNVEAYQRRLLPAGFGEDGGEPLGARWLPLERVGAYVPGGVGGALPLVSTVLMNLIPAKVAGVPELVMATPPRADGRPAPELLAAAHLVGVDAVHPIGGVPAIAALACGTDLVARVDKIVGPGNLFVTLAKRHAYGRVDIDMLAGPSEVLVISDGGVDPAWIAADLLSQAEHDPLAMAVLVTTAGDAHADAVDRELARQIEGLPAERRAAAEASLTKLGCCILCEDLDRAAAIADRFAPEHCEILVAEPEPVLAKLRHAGAIFVGRWSPEPIGDYLAGPSHTLPTGGSARMWSGIGTDTFLRRSSVIRLDEAGFRRLADDALTLARREGLEAHARSIAIRLGGGG